MNLLFLSHRLPFPPNKGDKIRSHALFTHLAARHTVHLGCFIDDVEDFAYANAVNAMTGRSKFFRLTKTRKLLRSVLAFLNNSSITAEVYQDAELQQWVDTILQRERIDCAVVFSSSMAPYLLSGKYLSPRRVVFDMVDLDSDKWLQYSKTVGPTTSWIYRREANKLLEVERAAAEKFALTYLVSPYEVECFSRLAPESATRIKPLSNGVNSNYFLPGVYASPFPQGVTPIVMTGRMDYWPNVEGALWFANVVLPLVKRQISNARFYVVGGQPVSALRKVSTVDVQVTGEVSDVRPYIAAAGVVVAPLRIARGVQNKVLEALAMGVPVVATGEASRGLAAIAGRDLWVANSADDFARDVVNASRSKERDVVAGNGRAYIEKYHNWNELLATFDTVLNDVSVSSSHQQKTAMECL